MSLRDLGTGKALEAPIRQSPEGDAKEGAFGDFFAPGPPLTADFAKIIEVFYRHAVSFVSVTQAFNTTSSMAA